MRPHLAGMVLLACAGLVLADEPQSVWPPSPGPCDVAVRFRAGADASPLAGLAVVSIDAGPRVTADGSVASLSSGHAFLIDLGQPPLTLRLDPCAPERTWTVWVMGRGRWSGVLPRQGTLSFPVPNKPEDAVQLYYERVAEERQPVLGTVLCESRGDVTFALRPGWIGGTENDLMRRLLFGSVDGGRTYVPIGPWDPRSTYKRPERESLTLVRGPWRATDLRALRQDTKDPEVIEYRHLVGCRLVGSPAQAELLWTRQRLRKYANPEIVSLVPEIGSMFVDRIKVIDARK
jgi:hypothetical protein